MEKSPIEQIIAHYPIAPFVAPYTCGLKSSGHGFFLGFCPFHKSDKEKKARKFWVNAAGGSCGCFVPRCPAYCNRAEDPNSKPLDVVNFWALLKGIDISEAVHQLLENSGIE